MRQRVLGLADRVFRDTTPSGRRAAVALRA